MLINRKVKALGIANANNSGTSPFAELLVDNAFAEQKQYELERLRTPALIKQASLFTQNPLMVSTARSLFNRSALGNIGIIVKPKTNTSLSMFSNLYTDKVQKYQESVFNNETNASLSFYENTARSIMPFQQTNQIKLVSNLKQSRLVVLGSANFGRLQEYVLVKSLAQYNSITTSKLADYGAGIFLTKRKDSTSATDFSLQGLANNRKQYMSVASGEYRLIRDQAVDSNFQQADFDNKLMKVGVKHYKKYSNVLQTVLAGELYCHQLSLKADLINHDSLKGWVSTSGFLNQSSLNVLNGNLLYEVSYTLNRLKLTAGVKGIWQYQTISTVAVNDSVMQYRRVLPSLQLSVKAAPRVNISLNATIEPMQPDYSFLASNPIMDSYRSFAADSNYIVMLGGKRLSFSYVFNDISGHANLVFSYQYLTQANNRIPVVSSGNMLDSYTYFFSRQPMRANFLYGKYDKYFSKAGFALSVKNTAGMYSNPVFFNGSKASSNMFTNQFGFNLRPSFVRRTNINLGAEYYYQQDLLSKKSNYQLSAVLDGSANISAKWAIGTTFRSVVSDFFLDKKPLHFGNLYAWYTIKPQRHELKLSCINIAGTGKLAYGERNAGFERFGTERILPRMLLLEWSMRF